MFTFVDFRAFVEDVVHAKSLTHVVKAETLTEVNFVCPGHLTFNFHSPVLAQELFQWTNCNRLKLHNWT